MVRSGKVSCEGCGSELHPVYMTVHRLGCAPYRAWSATLPHPCRKGCGMGFPAPRARANHERSCTGEVVAPVATCRLCGDKYGGTLTAHLNGCRGPASPPDVPADVPAPSDVGCGCGYEGASRPAAAIHRSQCAWWWSYSKRLPEHCEGCGRGFGDVYSKRSHAQACPAWQSWRAERDVEERTHPCPSCGVLMRGPQLGLHVRSCPGPWTASDWDLWRHQNANGRGELRSADLVLDKDFVACAICGDRFRALSYHLEHVHGITMDEYRQKHGGRTFSQRTLNLRKDAWTANHGVDHPRKDPEINARAEATRVRTMMERYGAATPMEAGLVPCTRTRPEIAVEGMAIPGLHYTGDHAYWVNVRTTDGDWRPRNPDFVFYTDEQMALVSSGVPANEVRSGKVVEVLGDYWHGPERQGVGRAEYVAAREAEYAGVRVRSLFVWESEVESDPDGVRGRVASFLGR